MVVESADGDEPCELLTLVKFVARYAHRLAGRHGDDVAQDALLKLLPRLQRLPPLVLLRFARRAVRWSAGNHRRRERRHPMVGLEDDVAVTFAEVLPVGFADQARPWPSIDAQVLLEMGSQCAKVLQAIRDGAVGVVQIHYASGVARARIPGILVRLCGC